MKGAAFIYLIESDKGVVLTAYFPVFIIPVAMPIPPSSIINPLVGWGEIQLGNSCVTTQVSCSTGVCGM